MKEDNNGKIKVIEENTRPYVAHIYTDYLKLPDREVVVLLALKSFAWNHKDNCYPSIESIAKIVDKKDRQVREILQSLENKGLIRIVRTPGKQSTYYITNKLYNEDVIDYNLISTPRRKSAAHPGGNPPHTPAEIRRRSINKINNNNNINPGSNEPVKLDVNKRIKAKIKISQDYPQKIVDLYHEMLPNCSRVVRWTKERQSYLTKLIGEINSLLLIDNWKIYFEYVSESDYLCGKKVDFIVDLDWLIKLNNFTKIQEGRYHKKFGER
jgi:hypothetical protein